MMRKKELEEKVESIDCACYSSFRKAHRDITELKQRLSSSESFPSANVMTMLSEHGEESRDWVEYRDKKAEAMRLIYRSAKDGDRAAFVGSELPFLLTMELERNGYRVTRKPEDGGTRIAW